MLADRGWPYYNGYNVTFRPNKLGSAALLDAHRELWRRAFSPGRVAARGARTLRRGALMMSSCMNGFYGLKRLRGNQPIDMRELADGAVAEVEPVERHRPQVGRPGESDAHQPGAPLSAGRRAFSATDRSRTTGSR